MSNPYFEKINHLIQNNDIVLFMKGTATQPKCGFSGLVVQILNRMGVAFQDVDVLEDEGIRQAIKEFTDWPTLPQLYIKGEFIGGCDITRDLYTSGELEELLTEKGILQAA